MMMAPGMQNQMQPATDPTQMQNAMMMQLLNQNAAGQNASLGNMPTQNMGVNPGTPVQAGTPVGQPGISPQAYGAMFGMPQQQY